MNLITETEGKLEYQKSELNEMLECSKKQITKDCRHHLQDEIDKTKKRINYYSNVLEELEKSSKNTEWELGTNGDKYFLFLKKDNLNIVVDISISDAFRIERDFNIKAVEYPF